VHCAIELRCFHWIALNAPWLERWESTFWRYEMKVYTYSEARQRLARILDEARAGGEVRIKRRDGTEFSVRRVDRRGSPLDVSGVDTDVSREDIVAAIRESREREPNLGPA
jgi:antitoxin (DNA-binding transcriptional repressor) of toxin-antitoxin stability system